MNTSSPCWQIYWQQASSPCYYLQDGSPVVGSFSQYEASSPDDLLSLHKWFAYGQMVMQAWLPVRVMLDSIWPLAGQNGYRPQVLLDQDLEAYLYGRTGLEAQIVNGPVSGDILAQRLDILEEAMQPPTSAEWNYMEGRELWLGAEAMLYAPALATTDWLQAENLLTGTE